MSDSKKPDLTTIPGSEDELRASVESLKRTLPVLMDLAPQLAVLRFRLYQSYVSAGFSEAQALQLCKGGLEI